MSGVCWLVCCRYAYVGTGTTSAESRHDSVPAATRFLLKLSPVAGSLMLYAQIAGDSAQPRLSSQLTLSDFLHAPLSDAADLNALTTATAKGKPSALQRLVECVERQLIAPLFARAETRREKRIETEVLLALIQVVSFISLLCL